MNTCVLAKNGLVLIQTVEMALGLGARLKGLLGRSSSGAGYAMYLAPCNSIHTFFMRFDLDLIFLSSDMRIVKIVREVVPNRVVLGGSGARAVLELESGWFPWSELQVGDEVSVK